MAIKENFLNLQKEIPDVRIIAVSKYVNAEKIIEAYESGIRNFGENKIQDAEKKRGLLPESIEKGIIWHFLGHIQTNKAKKLIGHYNYIHSVDSLKVAEILSQTALSKGIKQKILIQVNVAEEETKYGFSISEIKESFKEILNMDSLEITGLMTMAPFVQEEETLRKVFKGLRELRNQLQNEHKLNIPELSMGMSNDYKLACEEGSTMVRIGQAIFKEN